MRIMVVDVEQPWLPVQRDMRLRLRHRLGGTGKKAGAGTSGGHANSTKQYLKPPAGIRRHPRGRTRYA